MCIGLGVYRREREYGTIDNNINNNNYKQNKETTYNSKTSENNQYEDYSYNNYTQNNLNTNQHQNEKQTYNRNINFLYCKLPILDLLKMYFLYF